MIFLLHYDPSNGGRLVRILEFKSGQEDLAATARLELEVGLLAAGSRMEVVTLEADSLEELAKTHSRYFSSIRQMTEVASKDGQSHLEGKKTSSDSKRK